VVQGGASEAKRGAPWDGLAGEARQGQVTVDVVIPVFNDAGSIGDLLHDLMLARQRGWFRIQSIHVISDASTDGTDDVIRRVAGVDPRVKLVRKKERKGKQDSINLALAVTNADVVVFIDADVRFADRHSLAKLLRHFHHGDVAVVQGGLVRCLGGLSVRPATLAAHFDWILVDRIRRRKALSWWSVDGRVMGLSRDFYHDLVLPSFLADDQFVFYACVQQGRRFVWADDALFNYGPPVSMSDFSHQWSRYFFYTGKSCEYFGEDFIRTDMSVPGLRRTILSCLWRHPLCGVMWLMGFAMSRVEFMLHFGFDGYARGLFWTRSSRLKNVGQTWR